MRWYRLMLWKLQQQLKPYQKLWELALELEMAGKTPRTKRLWNTWQRHFLEEVHCAASLMVSYISIDKLIVVLVHSICYESNFMNEKKRVSGWHKNGKHFIDYFLNFCIVQLLKSWNILVRSRFKLKIICDIFR